MSAGDSPRPLPSTATLPLLDLGDPDRVILRHQGQAVAAAAFLAQAERVAEQLPNARHVVNLCEDRHAFLLAFCAALMRGQTTLMPPSRAPAAVAEVLAAHAGSYSLGEHPQAGAGPAYHHLPALNEVDARARSLHVPQIPGEQLAVIGYTSGSTGTPQANAKTWASFTASNAGNLDMFRRHLREPLNVLATVPPQHMYGMEMSVLLPLLGNIAVHSGRPLLPADVAAGLAELPESRVLVSTPVHLRALVTSGQPLPPLAAIVSATAPLPVELARAAEEAFHAPLLEVFGSTETCVIATRRSAREDGWTRYPGVYMHPQPDGTRVEAPQLAAPVTLADLVEVTAEGFRLKGRNSDLLDMAGKRASLADLNQRLLAIEGVRDGVIFQPGQNDGLGVRRLAALVVAPGRSSADILAALRRVMDPVFLPRPLRMVDALPRNATGKLPRQALVALLERH